MRRRHGAARTIGVFTVSGDHECGPGVSLNHTTCCDTNHAAMPPIAIEHNTECIAKIRFRFEARLDLLHDAPLFFLALAIELVEAGGKFPSAGRILHTEQVDNVEGHVHASRRIESRRYT